MKKYISLIVLTLALSFSGAKAQDWMAFQAANCLCKAKFPARPDLSQQQVEGFKSHQSIARFNEGAYLLDYSFLQEPLDKANAKIASRQAVKDFGESLNANLVKAKKWKVNGWEGFQTQMEVPGSGEFILYNVVIVNRIRYEVAVLAKEEHGRKVGKKFVKSFKLT